MGIERGRGARYHGGVRGGPPSFDALERESYRIVGMICAETVPAPEIDAAIAALRSRTESEFPERSLLFDETFGRRFARLRTRFVPSAALLPTIRSPGD